MLEGRFFLGVGSGENLNEHILGDRWPPAEIRQEMLEEAVEVMRELWKGEFVTHRGRHYTVENARIYDPPDGGSLPVYVAAAGPTAAELSGRIGDGFIGTAPQSETIEIFWPRIWLSSVDFPTFGRPTKVTNPERSPGSSVGCSPRSDSFTGTCRRCRRAPCRGARGGPG